MKIVSWPHCFPSASRGECLKSKLSHSPTLQKNLTANKLKKTVWQVKVADILSKGEDVNDEWTEYRALEYSSRDCGFFRGVIVEGN